jgi:hypothetical protein
MKTKHTKGKWETQGSLDNIEVIVKTSIDGLYSRIAHVANWDQYPPNYEEAEANAKLIAAAPELLETLIEILELGANISIQELAHKAIKKATE